MKSQPKLRLSALALAAAVTLGLASPDALALALGRVTVQSALGEPLRADIDLPQINAEEVSSLKATIAAPSAYRAAGLEYSPALTNVQITLQKRPDGSYFLHLASDRPVNEPFVDVILETNWATGRVQRDFTMLFDPPALRQAAPGTPLPAQATAPSAPRSPAARTSPSTAERAAPATPSAAARPAPTPAPAPAPSRAAAPTPAPAGEGKRVTVQGGDTAGKLAAANKPASVSLDQMLIALLRANPDAFVDGNVNRLRAGAVLEMPSAEQASSVAPQEARQTLVAQSRDFNEFRRRLAEGVPAAAAPTAGRQAAGRLQAQVEDKKAAEATPDKLTLSKGAVQGKSTSADKIARERAAQDSATRIAELDKNIAELNRLSSSTPGTAGGTGTRPGAGITTPPGVPAVAGAPASAPAAATVAKVAAAPTPAATPASPESKPAAATAAAAPASSPAAASATPASTDAQASMATAAAPAASAATAAASAAPAADASPVAAPAKPVAAAKPAPKRAPPPPEPSLLDDMLENPLIPALGVGLLAVLLGFGFYKVRQKRKTAAVDSSFLESRLQPDSFFGASGGQRVDTAETNNPTGSSMVYSPSQLDAAGDVDPVAEADVYLAYGRDLQAEEILKEALRINPQRVAIHSKLLEIYAKRRDAKAFETVAAEAYNLTRGTGHEWEHICELGRELDASNPMYRPGGQPGGKGAGAAPSAPSVATVAPVAAASPVAVAAGDIDLDLDFSLGDEPAAEAPAPVAKPAAKPAASAAPVVPAPAKTEPQAMDFSSVPSLDLPPVDTAPAKLDSGPGPLADNSLDFEPVAPAPKVAPAPAPVAAAPAAKGEMLEFDLGGLSLDLPGSAPAAAPAAAAPAPAVQASSLSLDSAPAVGDLQLGGLDEADNPLATKLALAEEFNAIGDADGARSLAEEVLAEASGDLKSRAQRLLAEIG